MRCKSCGNDVKSDYKFCPFCAARLTQDFEDHFGELEPAVFSMDRPDPSAVLYGEGRELPSDTGAPRREYDQSPPERERRRPERRASEREPYSEPPPPLREPGVYRQPAPREPELYPEPVPSAPESEHCRQPEPRTWKRGPYRETDPHKAAQASYRQVDQRPMERDFPSQPPLRQSEPDPYRQPDRLSLERDLYTEPSPRPPERDPYRQSDRQSLERDLYPEPSPRPPERDAYRRSDPQSLEQELYPEPSPRPPERDPYRRPDRQSLEQELYPEPSPRPQERDAYRRSDRQSLERDLYPEPFSPPPQAAAAKPSPPTAPRSDKSAYTVYRPGVHKEPVQPAKEPQAPTPVRNDRRGNPFHHDDWADVDEDIEVEEEIPNLITFEVPDAPEVFPEQETPQKPKRGFDMDQGRADTAPYVSMKPDVASEPKEPSQDKDGPGPVFKALLIIFIMMVGLLTSVGVYWLTAARDDVPQSAGFGVTDEFAPPDAEEAPSE